MKQPKNTESDARRKNYEFSLRFDDRVIRRRCKPIFASFPTSSFSSSPCYLIILFNYSRLLLAVASLCHFCCCGVEKNVLHAFLRHYECGFFIVNFLIQFDCFPSHLDSRLSAMKHSKQGHSTLIISTSKTLRLVVPETPEGAFSLSSISFC